MGREEGVVVGGSCPCSQSSLHVVHRFLELPCQCVVDLTPRTRLWEASGRPLGCWPRGSLCGAEGGHWSQPGFESQIGPWPAVQPLASYFTSLCSVSSSVKWGDSRVIVTMK